MPHPLLRDGKNHASLPITMDNLGFIRRFPYGVCENIVLDEVEKAREEVELWRGVKGSEGVRCGVMYIGCSYPLTDTEKKALEAAAIVHKETGVAMAINPGPTPLAPPELLDILLAHGVSSSAICISHMDRTFSGSQEDLQKKVKLCQRGCYICHSFFGKECSHYKFGTDINFPSDAQKIQLVKALIAAGCSDRVLVSHDVVCKHEWTCYGGTGYAHLLEHIAPKFLLDRGLEQTMLDKINTKKLALWMYNARMLLDRLSMFPAPPEWLLSYHPYLPT